MNKFAVVGEKITHTKSPLLHELIHEDMGIEAEYGVLDICKEELESVVDLVRNDVYKGLNITIPYKIEVMKYLDEVSIEAQKIGAVNTICKKNGKVIGYNTDFMGFKEELKMFGVDVKNKSVALIGCGGAAKAILAVLEEAKSKVVICETDLSKVPPLYESCIPSDLEKRDYDILINASPIGMFPKVDNMPVSIVAAKKAKAIVDIIYNPKKTKLMTFCDNSYNGLCMLTMQAIKSNEIWYDCNLSDRYEKIYLKFRDVV